MESEHGKWPHSADEAGDATRGENRPERQAAVRYAATNRHALCVVRNHTSPPIIRPMLARRVDAPQSRGYSRPLQ